MSAVGPVGSPGARPLRGLTPKVTLVFVLFAAALLAGVGALAYRSGRDALRAATVAELLSTAAEKQAALDAWVEDRQTDLADIAALGAVRAGLAALLAAPPGSAAARAARDRLVGELSPWARDGQRYLGLFVMEPDHGRVLAAIDPEEEGKFREDRPYFVEGRRGPYAQNLHYSLQQRGPTMVVAAPIRDASGRLLGVLAARLSLVQLSGIVNRRAGLRETDDAYLVTRSRLLATQPRFLPDPAVLQRGIHTEAVKRCFATGTGAVADLDYRGVPALAVYRWLPERQLCLIVKTDAAEALAPARAFGWTLAGIGGLVLLAASGLAAGLARTITGPVRALQAGAARFGHGDLAVHLPEHSRDELGLLAREFNAMAARIASKDAELRDYARELEREVQHRTAALGQLEGANRELEAFSYSVSHDLRAPLRAIDGFSRILLDAHGASLAPEARRYLELVRSNVKQMGELVDDLLALARFGRQALNVQPVEPAAIVREALETLRGERDGRPVELSVGELPACHADPVLLRQVWLNLLSNALKFSRRREPARIEVGAGSRDGQVVYYVRDNGVGFDMRYAGKLFGIFQRLHRAEEYEGTGIGLATVQRIVQRHGGRVWGEAAPDQGATFSFTLGTLTGGHHD